MNERAWKLVGGFARTMWKGIALVWLAFAAGAGANAFAASRGTEVGIGWLSVDLMRTVMVSIPIIGILFMEREVVTLPVSIKDAWRAKWFLATVGLTLLSASARAAVVLLPGAPQLDAVEFLGTTVIEFLSAGTCAACAVFLLKTPDLVAKQPGVFRWVAGLTWLSMPVWCFYLRSYSPNEARGVTPVFAGVVAALAIATYLGFHMVPVAHGARMPTGADVQRGRVEVPSSATSIHASLHQLGGRGAGVVRWASREILWATGFGLGGVLFIAAIEVWLPTWEGHRTFAQVLSGSFVPDADVALGLCVYPLPVLLWLNRIVLNLRLLRSVPLSTWTLVRVITVALGASWATMWFVQALAYRWSAGTWPSAALFSMFFVILVLLAATKTLLLILGGRFFLPGAIVMIQTSVLAATRVDAIVHVAVIQAAALSIGVVSVLMLADLAILTRTDRLYRASTAVV